MEIKVLDYRGRAHDEHRVDGGHYRGERPRDENACPEGRHQPHGQRRHREVADLYVGDDGAAHSADQVHREEDEADCEGADYHRAVHRTRVLIAEALLRRLRQAEHADADEHPERKDEWLRYRIVRAGRRQKLRVDSVKRLHDVADAAASRDDGEEYRKRGDEHHHALDGVGEDDGAEAADRRVDYDGEAEYDKPRLIGVARDRFKEPRAADELREHRGHEEDEQRRRRKYNDRVAVVARTYKIRNRHGLRAARDEREALAQHAERQESRRHLYH